MNKNYLESLQNLLNDPSKRAEVLMPGYSKHLEKIIDQIIASAKTKFKFDTLVQSFQQYGLNQVNDFADYFVRAVVIEFGISMDFESGLDNCEQRLREIEFPFIKEELKQITQQLLPALKKELGAIQKINYLSRELTPIDVIIEKIKSEVEIKTDDLGLL
ncbi:MAG: hypothetical protein RL308_518 [Bacteroidota bacterium]|jgi:hypothetical protein